MRAALKSCWPELLLVAMAVFFTLREIGSFPAAWVDDGFYMIIARNIAEGRGYMLPVLTETWEYPFFLAVGPTLLWPVALAVKLFGFSVTVARVPMILYLWATMTAFYWYARRTQGQWEARWATALLISLSAFINTGKPVLGEIPGHFFLLLGLLALHATRTPSWRTDARTGALYGLSIVTKLTYGLILPALGVAAFVALIRRNGTLFWSLVRMGAMAVAVLALFNPILNIIDPGFFLEVESFGLAEGGTQLFRVLRTQPEMLLRFQYLYFGCLAGAAALGIWRGKNALRTEEKVFLSALGSLFIFYFLNERGWYRHLLPGHLVLLPFVPLGVRTVLGMRIASAILAFCVLSQGVWQWDHRGSRTITEAAETADVLEQSFRDVPMVIEQPEIFARLSQNPHWLFLSEEVRTRDYPLFEHLPLEQEEHCLPVLRKVNPEDARYTGRLIPVHRRYMLIEPPSDCSPRMDNAGSGSYTASQSNR